MQPQAHNKRQCSNSPVAPSEPKRKRARQGDIRGPVSPRYKNTRAVKELCQKIHRKYPQLSRGHVKKLFFEASKRKHPHMSSTARKEMLLAVDAKARKQVALHLLHSLRCAAKTLQITDGTDIALIFPCAEKLPEQSSSRWHTVVSSQCQSTSEMGAFEKQFPLIPDGWRKDRIYS